MSDLPYYPGYWQGLWTQLAWSRNSNLICPGFRNLSGISTTWHDYFRTAYPRNHTFQLRDDRLVPNPRLARRVAALSRLYPARAESLVDLSCSKGYFVFHARCQTGCGRALGVDIDGVSLAACQELAARFEHRDGTRFAQLRLPELARSIDEFGGPFETALLVNTYQYLRLGSDREPAAARSHRDLFAMLQQICRGRLIFHNRLAFNDLQETVRSRTQAADAREYHPDAILEAADEFFTISRASIDRQRPVLVLENRATAISRLAVAPHEVFSPVESLPADGSGQVSARLAPRAEWGALHEARGFQSTTFGDRAAQPAR